MRKVRKTSIGFDTGKGTNDFVYRQGGHILCTDSNELGNTTRHGEFIFKLGAKVCKIPGRLDTSDFVTWDGDLQTGMHFGGNGGTSHIDLEL